jgi:pimeloyl-ACP methyl ester carboxylesterase
MTCPTRARRRWRLALLAAVVATPVVATTSTAVPAAADGADALPIVFVHGFSGSAAQYETQALRFASNGYPNVVTGIDRISATPGIIYPILDEFFDAVMAETGNDQIYAVGHSQGTAVMYGYLSSSEERAARVAKYIGIDGLSNPECPGGVECMGIWARGNPARVLGPRNVQFADQGHTQSVGSAESFAAQYEFFTGTTPDTTKITKGPGHIHISGRALNFPANTGIDGSVLDVYEVRAKNGTRLHNRPLHTVAIGADGNFGPLEVKRDKYYELQLTRQGPDRPLYQHFYYEPFQRSNHLLRLNLAPIGSPLSEAIQRGPHTTVSIVRQKEWWGANPNDALNVDTLEVSTRIGRDVVVDAGHIINGATAPYAASTIAVLSFDIGVDGVTDTSALFPLGPFLSGVDVYMPATEPPSGTITFRHQQRQVDPEQVINTPNWSSQDGHSMTVNFRDWVG